MVGARAPKQSRPRRRLPIAEKRRIVELTLQPGTSIHAVAREQGVNRSSLYQWQARYRSGKLEIQPSAASRLGGYISTAQFLPVTIATAAPILRPVGDCGGGASVVQIALPSGVTLRIETAVLDAAFICALVAQVQR